LGNIVEANPEHPDLFGAQELITIILEIADSKRMWSIVEDAVVALGKIRATTATDLLLRIADDCDGSISASALESLCQIADDGQIAASLREKAKEIEGIGVRGYYPIRTAAFNLLTKLRIPKEDFLALRACCPDRPPESEKNEARRLVKSLVPEGRQNEIWRSYIDLKPGAPKIKPPARASLKGEDPKKAKPLLR
ncbi:MAG: hypothetical protein ABIH29_02655, partial [Candidatus Micrarchaeota archaeon]